MSPKAKFDDQVHVDRPDQFKDAVAAERAVASRELVLATSAEASDGPAASHALLLILASIARDIKRIADKLDPPDDQKPVGTPYVAKRLGQTTTWVAEMARRKIIPKSCVVVGTGDGKPWKFHRAKIEEWIKTGR